MTVVRRCAWALVLLPVLTGGCQPSQETMTRQLSARMSMIDFSGLGPAKPVDKVIASAAVPRSWQVQPTSGSGMFTHAQWRNPRHSIAVGVVHVRLPLPMSAQTLVWLAKTKYGAKVESSVPPPPDTGKPADRGSEKGSDKSKVPGGRGRLLAEWTDSVGREWVEAENDRYHLRGYAVTCGWDAWLVYTGAKRTGVLNPVDLQLAIRSMESVVPDPLAPTTLVPATAAK